MADLYETRGYWRRSDTSLRDSVDTSERGCSREGRGLLLPPGRNARGLPPSMNAARTKVMISEAAGEQKNRDDVRRGRSRSRGSAGMRRANNKRRRRSPSSSSAYSSNSSRLEGSTASTNDSRRHYPRRMPATRMDRSKEAIGQSSRYRYNDGTADSRFRRPPHSFYDQRRPRDRSSSMTTSRRPPAQHYERTRGADCYPRGKGGYSAQWKDPSPSPWGQDISRGQGTRADQPHQDCKAGASHGVLRGRNDDEFEEFTRGRPTHQGPPRRSGHPRPINDGFGGRFGGKDKWAPSLSPSSEDTRIPTPERRQMSRERERARRKKQMLTMQKLRPQLVDTTPLFWDGFQWVPRAVGAKPVSAQEMNATRKARRLHIGSLPLEAGLQEDQLRCFLWVSMVNRGLVPATSSCPILNVWFARDRGGRFGFVELQSVEATNALLSLNGIELLGTNLKVNRPSDMVGKDETNANSSKISGSGVEALNSAWSLGAAAALGQLSSPPVQIGPDEGPLSRDGGVATTKTTMNGDSGFTSGTTACAAPEKDSSSCVVRISCPCLMSSAGECQETLEDIQDGCTEYGTIRESVIISENILCAAPFASVGDIFLRFSAPAEATKCCGECNSRLYDGRLLQAQIFDEPLFEHTLKEIAAVQLATTTTAPASTKAGAEEGAKE
eukprot:GHVU01102878.1.p1 GENE.GHVU01102878.1~~GHVU01102878.1.p1  ORF type:complete len:668 (-),score=91.86 GHVU01102878.1:837-2840(-)